MDHTIFSSKVFFLCLLSLPPCPPKLPLLSSCSDVTADSMCAVDFLAHVELPIGIVHCTHACLPVCT